MRQYFPSLVVFAVLASLTATSAHAQEAQKGKRPFVLEEVLIEGQIQKPEAYFILQPKSFDFLQNIETQAKFNAEQLVVDAVKSDIF